MSRRRRIYPMPVEGLVDNPDFIAMPAAGVGILFRLCLHFWLSECRPLPKSDDELQAISRAHRPTWRTWRHTVLKIFEAIRPDLEAYYALRESRRASLSIGAHMTNAKRRAKALQSSLRAHDSLPAYASGFVPKRDPTQPDRPRPSPAGRPTGKLMVDRPRFC
jgi:hypothetical protein